MNEGSKAGGHEHDDMILKKSKQELSKIAAKIMIRNRQT